MLSARAGDFAGDSGTGATAVTGSSYTFLAVGFWLGLIFYADSHPGYRHGRARPRPEDAVAEAGTGQTGAGEAAGPEHERIDERSAALLG